jgi:hypothetical protein
MKEIGYIKLGRTRVPFPLFYTRILLVPEHEETETDKGDQGHKDCKNVSRS